MEVVEAPILFHGRQRESYNRMPLSNKGVALGQGSHPVSAVSKELFPVLGCRDTARLHSECNTCGSTQAGLVFFFLRNLKNLQLFGNKYAHA